MEEAVAGIHKFISHLETLDAALRNVEAVFRIEQTVAVAAILTAFEIELILAVPALDEVVAGAILGHRLMERSMRQTLTEILQALSHFRHTAL